MSFDKCKGYKCLNCRMRRVVTLPDWNGRQPVVWEFRCDKYKRLVRFTGSEVRKLQEQYEEQHGEPQQSGGYTKIWRM